MPGKRMEICVASAPPSPSEQQWAFITREQLGVRAIDQVGHKIGPNIAKRSGLGLNWYPIDRFKQTLVGTVEGYDFYGGSGDEADWNIYMRPTAAFRFIVRVTDEVRPAG